MAMPQQHANTVYDAKLRPWWNNLNDRVAYQREFELGGPEEKRIAQAMLSQDPLTPREEIRANMTTRKFPPRQGYPVDEITIDQVLNNNFESSGSHVNDSPWNDFSGQNGETNSTIRPNGMFW